MPLIPLSLFLLILSLSRVKPQCDYRPTLHPPTEVVFIVPDRTLGHLVTTEQWKGIENILDMHSANADTRMAIVQYGRDGRRGIVQKLTHSVEEARQSFRSSLMQNDHVQKLKDEDSLPADRVYIDAAGLIEVMFGTLSNTVSSSSKDDAVIRKGAGLGLRTQVPWHVVVLAVANGRNRVTLNSEKENEITQRFFDIIRPVVTKCIIEIFVHDECLNKADQACRTVLGDPLHESSYIDRIGGFNAALTLTNALANKKEKSKKEHSEDDLDEDILADAGYLRELEAVSLQSRLLVAGGHVRIYSLKSLSNKVLLNSISTLVSPPPWCDKCTSIGNFDGTRYARKCSRAGYVCISSHGCVQSKHVSEVWSDLPHRYAWDKLEMTPRSAAEGQKIADVAEKVGEKAGKVGQEMANRAREAAVRRGHKNEGKGDGGGGSSGGGSGMGMGGLMFEDGIPPLISRMGRKNSDHGHTINRHSTVKVMWTMKLNQQARRNILTHLLRSKARKPVIVRGATPSSWPALVQWRDLGGNFLKKLSKFNVFAERKNNEIKKNDFKIEVKVSDRVRKKKRDGSSHYTSAFFYDGHWKQSSQMGMAGLLNDERSGDYDVLKLNGASEKGIYILTDLLMQTIDKTSDTNKEEDNKNENVAESLLAADAVFRVPPKSILFEDMYPPVTAPSKEFVPLHNDSSQVFWVSTPGTATVTTSSSYHAIYTQLRGCRRFTIYSERHEMNFMVYPSIHPLAGNSRWNNRKVTAYNTPRNSLARGTAQRNSNVEGESERTVSTSLRAQLKKNPIPSGVPSWSIILTPGEMLYIPPHMYYHTEVLSKEESLKAASKDAGNAAAENAGSKFAEAAGNAAEEAHLAGSGGQNGGAGGGGGGAASGMIETEDVSITTIGEWSDPLMGSVVEDALKIDLVADKINTVAGRAFALRLHLDMVANSIVSFEGITAVGYKLLVTRYSGLEYLFPPLNGTCDAVHHIEHSKEFDRTGAMEYVGIPAEPTMSLTIRSQANKVAQIFAALDEYPHARAVRDILFNDYVENIIANILGPERVLWFLRQCMVMGGHIYYRAKIAEEKHWQDLWFGWKAPKRSKKANRRTRGAAIPILDSDTSLEYVEPTSPETPEPPQLTKIGKQFWNLPEL